MIDRRYTITSEYCGYDTPRWVVRFCGDWVGQHRSRLGAREIQKEHSAARLKEMGIAS